MSFQSENRDFINRLTEEMKIRGYSYRTRKKYREIVIKFLKSEKTPREFILDYSNQSQSTIRAVFLAIKFFYENVLKQEFPEQLQSLQQKIKLPVVLTREDISRMFYVTENPKHYVVLSLLYYAGLRLNEARNIKWTDIDFDNETIHLKKTKGEEERFIFIHEKLRKALENLGIRKQGFVLATDTGEPYDERTIQQIVRTAARKAKINKTVTPHTLRHTFATHLLEAGADIKFIQHLLGHKDIRTTQIYTYIANRDVKRLARLI